MRRRPLLFLIVLGCVLSPVTFAAPSAPPWMQALVSAPDPKHDEKAGAVLLFSEVTLTVQANGKIRRLTREAYRVLRPEAGGRDVVRADFDDQSKVLSMHAWCIPQSGKTYEVKDRDAIETALSDIENGELVSDDRMRLLRIPAAEPGNLIGYETETEDRPYQLADQWGFQDTVPVREAHYILQLPAGWSYKASWLNHAEVAPTQDSNGRWQWTVSDVAAVRLEEDMPPWRGVGGSMMLALIPPGNQNQGLVSWQEIGNWEAGLAKGRRDASPAIQQSVQSLTAAATGPLDKMRSLAHFVQTEIRYVAIELGIGGWQPHSATDVFVHRYGDCKDKVTLLGSMLKEAGIDSYYVVVNTVRGTITPTTPPNLGFNHMIIAIRLPPDVQDPSLAATVTDPRLGRLLIFDPTDDLTPFGRLSGSLQANYALLVAPDGGQLLELPQLPPQSSSVQRTATLQLDEAGTLRGDVRDVRLGDPAAIERSRLKAVEKQSDRLRLVESQLTGSLSDFAVTKAGIMNSEPSDKPFEWRYSLEAEHYARTSGDLLLVRPRVLGHDSSALLETKEPRENAIEFDGPEHDADDFDIALPAGYEVDELPNPVDLDYGFASYHSKSQLVGHVLHYSRVLEIRELSVPVSKATELREFYRYIASDERNVAVLKRAAQK